MEEVYPQNEIVKELREKINRKKDMDEILASSKRSFRLPFVEWLFSPPPCCHERLAYQVCYLKTELFDDVIYQANFVFQGSDFMGRSDLSCVHSQNRIAQGNSNMQARPP